MKNPQSTQNTLMRLTSPFQYGNGKNQIDCFLLFGTGTGITKNIFRYLGRERELPKSFPAIRDGNGKLKKSSHCTVREQELKAFPLGNIQEWEFRLMSGGSATNVSTLLGEFFQASTKWQTKNTTLYHTQFEEAFKRL